jgi:hypothetical protein
MPKIAVIGIAGPIENNRVLGFNNIDWPDFSGEDLATEFGLSN